MTLSVESSTTSHGEREAMDRIVIAGCKPYDGEYEFDTEERSFTILEWRWIKKIAGYMPLTIGDGWAGRDPDLVLVFAVIALHRAGKVPAEGALLAADRLANTEFDGVAIKFVGDADEAEDDADDPPGGSVTALPTPKPPTPNTGTSGRPTSGSSDEPLEVTGAHV